MKIVVIGGSGLIGSKVVTNLRARGHEVMAAMEGARVVVDVANSPSFDNKAVLEFFETSGRDIFAAEKTAGVAHLGAVNFDAWFEQSRSRTQAAQ